MSYRSRWDEGERSSMIDLPYAGLHKPLALSTETHTHTHIVLYMPTHTSCANVSHIPVFICIYVKRYDGGMCVRVCAPYTASLFANVCLSECSSLFLSHEPGATGECWECKPVMSDGDSLPEKQNDGGRWRREGDASRLLYRYCTNH